MYRFTNRQPRERSEVRRMTGKAKRAVRSLAFATVLRPPFVRHCSQTLYETLLGCCRMWEATGENRWKDRADRVSTLLLRIQQPDGGFDIGYDFYFGRFHRKGQSTSPELVGLLALCEYARLFGPEKVEPAAKRAAEWIRRHALDLQDGKVAIPYSPYTIDAIMVYNGSSFACGALGCYLGRFGGDEDLHRIYRGMVRHLESVFCTDANLPGRFWYYTDQSRTDLDESARRKVDYYHQMQQVEMHALAQQACPLDSQRDLIRAAADHIVALQERNPVIPYTNDPIYFKDRIHLWGLASVASGMLEAAVAVPERREVYREVARGVLEWIVEYAWNGEHFEAILNRDGSRVDPSYYMVRSDAWVFNALGAAAKQGCEGPWIEIAERCFRKMESVDFSGPESHASSLRHRLAAGVWRVAKRLFER